MSGEQGEHTTAPGSESATLVDSPIARARGVARSDASQPTPSQTAEQRSRAAAHESLVHSTLRAEEAARASEFGRVLAGFSVLGMVLAPILGEVAWLRIAATAALAVLAVVSTWVWRRARKPGGYTLTMFRVFASTALLTALILILYGGIYSSAPIVVMLGITFFGMGDDRVFAIGVCTIAAAAYVVFALLEVTGVMPDQGMFEATMSSTSSRVFLLAIVPAIYLVGQWNARAGRRATHEAVADLDRALKLVHQREAQLDEARQQVEAAQARGLGREGRYTGVIAGSYRLGEVIGRGGMGDVYAGSHVTGGAPAAVKLLQGEARHQPDLVARFRREAEITSMLTVPNVVTVYEVGEAPGGEAFIAMELLAGHDLAWHLRQQPQLPLSTIEALVQQVAAGLAAAHAQGVIHRDIKPHNLFLAESSSGAAIWKILDFGISKLRDSSGTLTQQQLVGTPGYMSPEQAQGREATERTDIFSFGAVLYRALTGRPAFPGSDPAQIMFEIVYGAPAQPSGLRPELHRDVEHFLAIALAKRPDDRFASVTELAARFADALAGRLPNDLRALGRKLAAAHPWKAP